MLKRIISGISARALGFGYLSWVKDLAVKLKLKGEVFTKDDGSMEIIAEGEEENLEKLTKKLEKKENSLSRVENFYIKWEEPKEEFEDFSIGHNK